MKINFFVSGIFKSGGMKIIFEYCNKLSEKGYDVILYYPAISYDFYTGEVNTSVRNLLHTLKNYLNFTQRCLNLYGECKFRIKKVPMLSDIFIRDAQANIATIWHTSFSIDNLSRHKGKKFYFIQDYEIWNADINKVNMSYKLPLTRITISNFLKELLKAKFNSDSILIRNGINFDKYNNINKNYSKKRKQITFINYDLEKKNSKKCIEAIEILKDKFYFLDFVSFGLKKFHPLPKYVNFIENPDENEIINIYSESDIFIFSSLEEGFALPPAEAMACKCAVVTSPVGAIPEYSRDKISAIYIDPNDTNSIVDGVSLLLTNNSLLERISENSFKDVRRFLDWDESVNKFEHIIRT